MLADSNLHPNARVVLEKLKITTRMYQAYLDISNVVNYHMDRGDYLMNQHVKSIKQNLALSKDPQEYFNQIKNGMGHEESFWELMKDSFCENRELFQLNEGYVSNQFWSLDFADKMQRELSRNKDEFSIC